MNRELALGGVVFSPVIVQLAVALILTVFVTFILLRMKFYQWVWHRPLVEVAIFFIIFGLLVVLAPDGITGKSDNASSAAAP